MTREEILRNHNSSDNQTVKGNLVDREFHGCFTHIVEKLLSLSYQISDDDLPTYDEIENYYSFPEFSEKYVYFSGGSFEDKESIVKEFQDKFDNLQDVFSDYEFLLEDLQENEEENKNRIKTVLNNIDNFQDLLNDLENEISELESSESEPSEIMQWFAVSDYMATKLKSYDQCILEYGCNNYWGRCTYGQAISLDYVIAKIAYDMEILEGQENHKYWIK